MLFWTPHFSVLDSTFFVLDSTFWLVNINKNYTYSVHSTQLERLEHMKDLGVIFDSELNSVQRKD